LIVPDVNLLLYAYNADAPQHASAKQWLEGLFSGDETIALPWKTVWGFIRLSTNPRVWPNPMSPETAFDVVRSWLAEPGVVLLEPGPRHLELLQKLAIDHQAAGRMLTNAALAALAIEYGATVASSDHDFRRFSGLRLVNPLALV
jgi:uncharacterized protein